MVQGLFLLEFRIRVQVEDGWVEKIRVEEENQRMKKGEKDEREERKMGYCLWPNLLMGDFHEELDCHDDDENGDGGKKDLGHPQLC